MPIYHTKKAALCILSFTDTNTHSLGRETAVTTQIFFDSLSALANSCPEYFGYVSVTGHFPQDVAHKTDLEALVYCWVDLVWDALKLQPLQFKSKGH